MQLQFSTVHRSFSLLVSSYRCPMCTPIVFGLSNCPTCRFISRCPLPLSHRNTEAGRTKRSQCCSQAHVQIWLEASLRESASNSAWSCPPNLLRPQHHNHQTQPARRRTPHQATQTQPQILKLPSPWNLPPVKLLPLPCSQFAQCLSSPMDGPQSDRPPQQISSNP